MGAVKQNGYSAALKSDPIYELGFAIFAIGWLHSTPKPDSLPPFEAEGHRLYEQVMWDMFERDSGRKRPADASKSPGPGEDV